MGLRKIKLQNKDYNLSILDLLRILDPSKTGKFMTLLLNELKSIPDNEVGEDYEESIGIYLDGMVGVNKVLKNKSTEPHQEIILDDKEYLILKPLNILSSRKYGASTKWCTSSSNPETFYSYSKKGVLLYIISRTNNDKFAVYYELEDKELSWWDTKDNRIDGLMVNLPKVIKNFTLDYILKEKHSNSHYFSKETKELLNKPTNEMVLPNIRNNGGFANPLPFNGVWSNNVNTNYWTPTSTNKDERIDELVTKTLEYHYTINALNKGGEEIN